MIRPTLLMLAAIAALAPAGPAGAADAPLTGEALTAACKADRSEVYRLILSPEITRQGATLSIAVVGRGPDNPWGGTVPNGCLTDWTVSAPKLARFAADHTKLILADDATVGASVRLTAQRGGRTAAVEFKVVARDAVVLTGYWSEVGDAQCPAGDPPMRELHLMADGKFEATWTPFETYVDFWGDYSFDAASGEISFTPTGGNHVPTDADLTGKATLAPDGRLRLDGVAFGSPRGDAAPPRAQGCALIFKTR